jgi:hypothetical protein
MSFEDWKTSFIAKLSEGATDSTAGSGSRMSIPSDVTLERIYDALKARVLAHAWTWPSWAHERLPSLPYWPSSCVHCSRA